MSGRADFLVELRGIRTDGARRSVRIPARPSEFLQGGATLTCVQAPKMETLLVWRPWHGPALSQQEPRRGSDGARIVALLPIGQEPARPNCDVDVDRWILSLKVVTRALSRDR